ncbi:MAG: RDD family protein [Planctomycetota bacterium]
MADQGGQPELVRCEVTGKMVPADEIVEIHGRQVCAEGKAILLERLKSGEALPGELRRPTVLRRFVCILLDVIILGTIGLAVAFVLGTSAMWMGPGDAASPVRLGLANLVVLAITVVYFGYMHGALGQTLGKMAGRIKVVNMDGSDIAMGRGFVRALWYAGPDLITPFLLLAGIGAAIVTGMGYLSFVYTLVDVILALVDTDKQRSLHDRLSGTRVIQLD